MLEGRETLFAAWLLTYAMHSTLLLCGAWLITSRLAPEHGRLKERLWRVALLGGILTASLQVAAGLEPFGGSWSLLRDTQASQTAEMEHAAIEVVAIGERTRLFDAQGTDSADERQPRRIELWAELAGLTDLEGGLFLGEPREPSAAGAGSSVSARIVLTLWALGAGACLLRLALALGHLRRHSNGRCRLRLGRMPHLFERLCADLSPVLRPGVYCAPEVSTPLTTGLWRPEILLPPRALSELTAAQQEAMLAHELAHATRRDPAWLLIYRALEAVFFFQPLNRLARRRLQVIAEDMCDDWAVSRTGRPLQLAQCLAEVADWIIGSRRELPAPAMAAGSSCLGARVERLLDPGHPPMRGAPRRWLVLGLPLALGAVVLIAPRVATAQPERQEPALTWKAVELDLSDATLFSLGELTHGLEAEQLTAQGFWTESEPEGAAEVGELLAAFRLLRAEIELVEQEIIALEEVIEGSPLESSFRSELEALGAQLEVLNELSSDWIVLFNLSETSGRESATSGRNFGQVVDFVVLPNSK